MSVRAWLLVHPPRNSWAFGSWSPPSERPSVLSRCGLWVVEPPPVSVRACTVCDGMLRMPEPVATCRMLVAGRPHTTAACTLWVTAAAPVLVVAPRTACGGTCRSNDRSGGCVMRQQAPEYSVCCCRCGCCGGTLSGTRRRARGVRSGFGLCAAGQCNLRCPLCGRRLPAWSLELERW